MFTCEISLFPNCLINFESCTESESKLVIKHLLKCFFFFLFYHCNTKHLYIAIHCTVLHVCYRVLGYLFSQLHVYAGVLYHRRCKVQLVHYFVVEIQLKLDISYK